MPETENAIIRRLSARIRKIASRLRKLEDESKAKPKDMWDRLSVLSPIIAGVVVAGIGFYATNIYDKRMRASEALDRGRTVSAMELQTVEKFFPHLTSSNENEKQAAIQVISSLGNAELAAKIAKSFGGTGAVAALTNIAATASTQDKATVALALADLYKQFRGSICRLSVSSVENTGELQKTSGTCVIVSSAGYALAAAHSLAGAQLKISATIGSSSAPEHTATLVSIVKDRDLALIKFQEPGVYVPVKISRDPLEEGESVTAMGYRVDSDDLSIVTGNVMSIGVEKTTLSMILSPGFSGSPVFNNKGYVVGVVTSGTPGMTFSVPIESATALLAAVGIKAF